MMRHNMHPATQLFTDTLAASLAMSAYGFGVTARMFGAVSDAFAFAAFPESAAKADPEAAGEPPAKSATVLSFETAARAKSAKPALTTMVTDDLKAIPGIGPRLEEVLNRLGILTLAQIAGWTQADIRRIDDELKLNGRILKDDWTGQAARLAAGTRGKK